MSLLEKKDKIIEAIKKGEPLEFIYLGGSQPNTLRNALFNSIKGNLVYGVCLETGKLKSFKIDKIELEISDKRYDPTIQEAKGYDSFDELIVNEKENLINQGWHVEIKKDCISLYTYRKDGKPHKHPKVSIQYEPISYYGKQMQRPYFVTAPSISSTTYKSIQKASNKFLSLAKELSPKK